VGDAGLGRGHREELERLVVPVEMVRLAAIAAFPLGLWGGVEPVDLELSCKERQDIDTRLSEFFDRLNEGARRVPVTFDIMSGQE
jgi:hypothetical protein